MDNTPSCRFIVLTGGPGAGKTAVLDASRQIFGNRLAFLPESASIVYSGGFPRLGTPSCIRAAQLSIFRVQEQLEALAIEEGSYTVALCDRGICDGAAYWPDGSNAFFQAIGIPKEIVYSRYCTVIHLKTPNLSFGYNNSNPTRTETPEEAALIDERIESVWRDHPNCYVVPATEHFTEKLQIVTNIIEKTLLSPARTVAHLGHIQQKLLN
ncbi:MAG: ATP-binding protein [Oligoflexia bacterium]|nr:ATP-binding protein [Oligoflexia bacterium]